MVVSDIAALDLNPALIRSRTDLVSGRPPGSGGFRISLPRNVWSGMFTATRRVKDYIAP